MSVDTSINHVVIEGGFMLRRFFLLVVLLSIFLAISVSFYFSNIRTQALAFSADIETEVMEKLERIIQERDGACNDCGIPYPLPVYEFYSENGIFRLNKARNMSLQRLREKVKDYVLLCKNCSAIREWEKQS